MRKTMLEIFLVVAVTAGVAVQAGSAWSQKKPRLKIEAAHRVAHHPPHHHHRHHRGIEAKKGARL